MDKIKIAVSGCNDCPFATDMDRCWIRADDEDDDIIDYSSSENTGHPAWCPLACASCIVGMIKNGGG